MDQFEKQPPDWALILLRIIVHPEFQEEIEGDLLEKYQGDLQNYGPKFARRRLYAELFSIAKPNLIFNVNRNTMKPGNWLLLLLMLLLVIVASVAPFLPGPGNNFSICSIDRVHQFAFCSLWVGLAHHRNAK